MQFQPAAGFPRPEARAWLRSATALWILVLRSDRGSTGLETAGVCSAGAVAGRPGSDGFSGVGASTRNIASIGMVSGCWANTVLGGPSGWNTGDFLMRRAEQRRGTKTEHQHRHPPARSRRTGNGSREALEANSAFAAVSRRPLKPWGTRVTTKRAAFATHPIQRACNESDRFENTATYRQTLAKKSPMSMFMLRRRDFSHLRRRRNDAPCHHKMPNAGEFRGFVLNAPLSSAIWR